MLKKIFFIFQLLLVIPLIIVFNFLLVIALVALELSVSPIQTAYSLLILAIVTMFLVAHKLFKKSRSQSIVEQENKINSQFDDSLSQVSNIFSSLYIFGGIIIFFFSVSKFFNLTGDGAVVYFFIFMLANLPLLIISTAIGRLLKSK